MKANLLFACCLLALIAEAGAVECGPSVRTETLQKVDEPVIASSNALMAHQDTLLQEQQRMLSSSNPAAFDKIQLENQKIESILNVSHNVLSYLTLAITLAIIRDAMIDPRDKKVVMSHLSNALVHLKTASTHAVGSVNKNLGGVSRPGIAIDVGNMRDAIAAVEKVVANCMR